MAEGENIGGVNISIGADYSDVLTAFTDIQNQATQAGAAVGQAFAGSATGIADFDDALQKAAQSASDASAAASGAASGVADLGDSLATTGASADEAAAGADTFGAAAEEAGAQASTGAAGVETFGGAAETAGTASGEAAGGIGEMVTAGLALGGIVVGVDALKDLAVESITAYANVQKATIAITQMTGSAQEATGIIEGLKEVAVSDALSFPNLVTAEQRMIAFGFSVQAIPGALQAAADAAAATGKDFDSVTSAMDRMSLSGTVASRQLASLGLSTQDLARVMGVSADQVAAAFKAMDPSERLQVIEDALGKFSGAAQAMATSVAGEWQNLKTQADFAFEGVGAALEPIANTILPAATEAIKAFSATWSSVIEVVGSVSTAFTSVTGALMDVIEPIQRQVSEVPLAKSAWDTLISAIENYNTYALVAAGIKGISNEVTILTGGADKLNGNIVQMWQNFDNIVAHAVGGKVAMDALGLSFMQAAQHAGQVYDPVDKVRAAIQGVIAAADKQDDTLSIAKAALDQLTDAYKNHDTTLNGEQVTLQQLGQAQANYDSALALAKTGVNALTLAQQGGHDAAQQAAKDQQEIATDAGQVAVMVEKVPASFQAYIASLSAGGAEGKKLESEIDSLITKFEKQAQTADGPVKSALVGMIAQLQAMKEMTAAAESPTDELGNKLLTLSDYIQAARDASIGLSTGTEKLTLDYEDAVTNLLVVHAEYVGGTKKLSDYEKAQNAVTKAQENLNDAEAAAGAKTSEATDDYSLLSVQLAIAKQKLEDVKNAYANDPTLAGKVQAAQREVTTLQNALNTALGQTPAAAAAAAAGIDWVAAACGKAINQLFNLTAAMQSTFAAEDKTPLGSDVAQLQGSFSPPANKHFINSITPGPLGGAGETITAVPNQGYMNDPFDPTGAAVTYAVGELELAKAGRLNAQQINSLIANGTIPGGSYPTQNGGTAGAAAASSSQGNLVMGGPVPTDLQALVTAGAGSAASSGAATAGAGSAASSGAATTGTDEIALLQATLDAANTQAQAVEASYDAGTASLDQLNAAMAVVAAANTALYTAVNNNASTTIQNSSNIQALTSATAAAATAAQTSTTATTNVLGVMSNLTSSVVNLTTATVAQTAVALKNVVGATTAIAGPGSGVVLGYGVAGTGGGTNVVGTTTSYNNNGGNTPLVFNFQGANFSSASPDMVQAAVTQALRTAGARF